MAVGTTSTVQRIRDYSQQLRRDSEDLVNAAKEARRRARIAVAGSRARNNRIAPAEQPEASIKSLSVVA
jgi:hypothetical protein